MTRLQFNFRRKGGLFGRIAHALLLGGALFLPLFLLPHGGHALAEDLGFLPGFEDVPKAPGLQAQEDNVLVFDSPAGRIVEVYAVGAENWGDVSAFYEGTLTQLGWTSRDATNERVRFIREGEVLTLDRFGADGALTVRFTLAPWR